MFSFQKAQRNVELEIGIGTCSGVFAILDGYLRLACETVECFRICPLKSIMLQDDALKSRCSIMLLRRRNWDQNCKKGEKPMFPLQYMYFSKAAA